MVHGVWAAEKLYGDGKASWKSLQTGMWQVSRANYCYFIVGHDSLWCLEIAISMLSHLLQAFQSRPSALQLCSGKPLYLWFASI